MDLKGKIADDTVVVTDDDTVGEFEVFSKVGSTWKASRDHDDLAMSTVDVTAIFGHPYFDVLMEDIMGLEENNDVYQMYLSKTDEKYDNVYDNYMNISNPMPDVEQDRKYNGTDFGGYFGNKGIYS